MVPDLGRVVVDTTARFFDDVDQRHRFKFGTFLQIVEVDHIGVVMFAVVELQGFPGVIGCQSIDGIGQGGQSMFHEVFTGWLLKGRIVETLFSA